MPGIGIMSSIDYSAKMQKAFEDGIKTIINPLPYIHNPPLDKLGYKAANLAAALATLLGDGQVTLIVTFGGLIACGAAKGNNQKSVISLIGGTLPNYTPPSGMFVGCCNLQSFTQDGPRITWLVNNGHAAAAANVGLLYNPQSVMANDETQSWTGGTTVAANNGVANPANFGLDFAQFPANIQAVVISADPYFNRHRNDLILAANNSTKYICYPLLSYRNLNGVNHPTHNNAVVIGPDLHEDNAQSAYWQMGVMAATVLNGGNLNPAIVPIAQGNPLPL
jgi:hypothetical protein